MCTHSRLEGGKSYGYKKKTQQDKQAREDREGCSIKWEVPVKRQDLNRLEGAKRVDI